MNDRSWRRVPAGDERARWVDLLLLADGSEQQVRSYLNEGELYAYREGEDARGIVLVIRHGTATAELRAVAVDPSSQARGVGRRMLGVVLDDLRSAGVRRVLVGTASAAVGPIAFYQKSGFRLLRVERDYFSEARGYPPDLRENGIAVRDMVWMDQWL